MYQPDYNDSADYAATRSTFENRVQIAAASIAAEIIKERKALGIKRSPAGGMRTQLEADALGISVTTYLLIR